MTDLIFLGTKITADGDCSHEIKRRLLLGRKAMTNLDSLLKSRDITLPTKIHIAKSITFSSSHVWMWESDYKESWAPKNWCFWTMVLQTLEGPFDSKEIQSVYPKGNQSWIFIGRTDAGAQTQYSGYLMQRTDSFEKTLLLGMFEVSRKRQQQRMRWLDGIINSMDMSLSKLQKWWRTGKPGVLQSTGSQLDMT